MAANACHARLVAMAHPKGIVHERIGPVRERLCKLGIISFISLVKSGVLKQQYLRSGTARIVSASLNSNRTVKMPVHWKLIPNRHIWLIYTSKRYSALI